MLKDSIQEQSERTLYDLMQTQLSDYFYGISIEITKIEDTVESGKYSNDEIIEMLRDLNNLIY